MPALIASLVDNVKRDELWQYTPDSTPLVVQSSSVTQQYPNLSITFTFNRPASGYAGPSVMTLQNLTGGATFTTAFQVVSGGDLVAIFQGVYSLPNGNYQVVLPAGSVTDANGDRHVDASDLAIVNANIGLTNATWSQGDFNGDGVVNAADLAIVNANLNVWLPFPAETRSPIPAATCCCGETRNTWRFMKDRLCRRHQPIAR